MARPRAHRARDDRLLSVPAAVVAAQFLRSANRASFADGRELGNLTGSLPLRQILGIWPAGDFRDGPCRRARDSCVLIAACALAAVLGAPHDRQAEARGAAPLCLREPGRRAVVVALGSPWLAAKALAVASPAVLFLALVGGTTVLVAGRRMEGALLVAAHRRSASPWSNGLAFGETSLAPARSPRRARGDRRAIRRAGARPDDRVPAVRRAPLPPPAGRRGRVGAPAAAGAAARRPRPRQGGVRGPRCVRAGRRAHLPNARPAPVAARSAARPASTSSCGAAGTTTCGSAPLTPSRLRRR